MGYSLRTWDYRYTLWLGFNPKTFQVGNHKLIPHNGRLPFISIGLCILPQVSALGSAWGVERDGSIHLVSQYVGDGEKQIKFVCIIHPALHPGECV